LQFSGNTSSLQEKLQNFKNDTEDKWEAWTNDSAESSKTCHEFISDGPDMQYTQNYCGL